MPTTTTIYLSKGATNITISAPEYPNEPKVDLDQFRARAMGGAVWTVTRATGSLYYPIYHWRTLPDAEHTLLRGFIYTTCSGSENTFDLIDWNTTAWTAQYLGGLEGVRQDQYDCWEVHLQLKLTA